MSVVAFPGKQEVMFTAYARAKPAGALAVGKTKEGRYYLRHRDGASLRDFQAAVQIGAMEAMEDAAPWLEPISVRAHFYFQRPKSHYGSGKNAQTVKASAPAHPITRAQGDVDKLTRALLDAMTGIVFRDDAQVAELEVYKRWADRGPERVQVEAWRNVPLWVVA